MSPSVFHRVQRVLADALGVVATLALAGCISFRLQVPGEPLPPGQLLARIETRQYAADFVERVARTADLIAAGTEDAGIRANTLRWKIGASSASRRAAYRAEPPLALADTWAFAVQMEAFFREGSGKGLFGGQQQAALDTAQVLAREADALAARRLDAGELAGYRKLVSDYAANERLSDLSFARAPIGPLWREAAAREESVPKSVGAGAEVRADASDRLDIYGQRIPDELRWRAELVYVEAGIQSADLPRALKRFEEELAKLSAVAQTQPEIAMQRLAALQAEMARISEDFDRRWGQTLAMLPVEREALVRNLETMRVAMEATIERERKELYAAFRAERAAVLDKLAEVVAQTLLLLCLLVLLVIGLPFLSGFIAGRATARRSQPPAGPTAR
jgi:hypothetical protein